MKKSLLLIILTILSSSCSQDKSYEIPRHIPEIESVAIISDYTLKKVPFSPIFSSDPFPLISAPYSIPSPLSPNSLKNISLSSNSFPINNIISNWSVSEQRVIDPDEVIPLTIRANFTYPPSSASCKFTNIEIDCSINEKIFFKRKELYDIGFIKTTVKPDLKKPGINYSTNLKKITLLDFSSLSINIKKIIEINESFFAFGEDNNQNFLYQVDIPGNKIIQIFDDDISLITNTENHLFFSSSNKMYSIIDGQATEIINFEDKEILSMKTLENILYVEYKDNDNFFALIVKNQIPIISFPLLDTPLPSNPILSNGNVYVPIIDNSLFKILEINTFFNEIKELNLQVNFIKNIKATSLGFILFGEIEGFNGIFYFNGFNLNLIKEGSFNNSEIIENLNLLYFTIDNSFFAYNPVNSDLELLISENVHPIKKINGDFILKNPDQEKLLLLNQKGELFEINSLFNPDPLSFYSNEKGFISQDENKLSFYIDNKSLEIVLPENQKTIFLSKENIIFITKTQ